VTAKIKTRRVLGFCCSAKLVDHGKTLYQTRDYPFGFDAQARQDVRDWAQDNRVKIDE